MADTTTQAARPPWHLWVVGGLSLLWNSGGAMDFTLTEMRNETYLKDFTPEQIAYFTGFPFLVVLAWGVATWGSLVGSVLLLLRRAWTVPVNLAVLVGIAVTFTHNYVLTDGIKVMGGEEKAAALLGFTAVIVVVAILLFLYARAMRKRGVLR
jgi:hypothetical protein